MTNFDSPDAMKVNSKIAWGRIFIFYVIAFGISGLFNSGLLIPQYQELTRGLMIKNWLFLPSGMGTLIAAFIAFKFDKKLKRTISLLGNNLLKNILISLVPAFVFTTIGIYNNNNINEHYYGFAFSSIALLYACTEEVFWRSYLLDALRPFNKVMYSLIIGILW